MVQPEDVAERRKAIGVAGTCSGTAEDVAVQRMPRGMLSGPGGTLWNVAGWRWKSRQPGDAVRRQAEDGTMVGGSAGDRSGGGRRVAKQKTHLEAEDTSEGGGRIGRRKMHWKAEDVSGAEAQFETERHGIRGFPLHIHEIGMPSLSSGLPSELIDKAIWMVEPCRMKSVIKFSGTLVHPSCEDEVGITLVAFAHFV